MERVLLPIFNDDLELIDYVMKTIRKIMFGRNVKLWYHWTGERDSGKTMITELMSAFGGEYVAQLDPNFFIAATFKQPDAKQLAPMLDHQFARMSICPEIDATKSRLSSERIKAITGGDEMSTRALYQELHTFQTDTTLNFFDNILPEPTQMDVMQTCKELKFPCKFVDDPDTHAVVPAVLKRKDDTVKAFIKQSNVRMEFIRMLLDDHIGDIVEPESVQENNVENQSIYNPVAEILQHIEISPHSSDTMTPRAIVRLLNANEIQGNIKTLKPLILIALGDPTNSRKPKTYDKSQTLFKYIRRKDTTDDDF